MTLKRQFIISLSAVALAVATALGAAQAQDPRADRAPAGTPGIEQALNDLGLTASQRDQLRSLRENHRQATEGLRQQIRAAQQTLQTTPRNDPNYATISAEARQTLEAARSQLRDQQALLQSNVRSLLTPEQVNKMELQRAERSERLAERRAERAKRRGSRDGSPPGG